MIHNAEYVLIGAGAGMSTAAGAQYGGKFFEENFGEFQKKYGKGPYMQDMYFAGFYPFPDEESYWGYWSKQDFRLKRFSVRREIISISNVAEAVMIKYMMQWTCFIRWIRQG